METGKWSNTALLVIDMQKDFVLDDGLSRVDGGKAIVPNVTKTVEIARQRGILVVWSKRIHNVMSMPMFCQRAGYIRFVDNLGTGHRFTFSDEKVVREHDPLGRDVELFRRHMYSAEKVGPTTKGSAGAELVDGLVIKEGDYKLVKTRFSAFFATHLHSFLQNEGIKNLIVAGVQTPNCIRQTVFDAVALDYLSVTVIIDATAAASPEVHAANIFDMKNIGVATPTLNEWCESDA